MFFFFIADFSVLSIDDNTVELETIYNSNENETIFELFKSNNNKYVATRQKHYLKVFYVEDGYERDSMKTKQFHSNIPYVGGTFHGKKTFLTVDMFRTIKKYNLECEKETGRRKMERATNNSYWCQLKSYGHNLLFADAKSIEIFDSRILSRKDFKSLKINLANVTELCDEITCLQTQDSENYFQVATTHNLFTFDIRKCAGVAAQVSRSTHQLKTPPLMMHSICTTMGRSTNESLIAMAGSLADDISVGHQIKNFPENTRASISPQKVLSVIDSYGKLQDHGILYGTNLMGKSSKDLAKRLNTGIRLFEKECNIFLFTQNCFGEIFYQNISTHPANDDEHIEFTSENLQAWQNALDMHQSKPTTFTATTVTNFNSISNILKYNLPKVEDEEEETETDQHVYKWQKTVDELADYKDILASDLLSVWNVRSTRDASDKPDPEEIVNNWLSVPENTGRLWNTSRFDDGATSFQ